MSALGVFGQPVQAVCEIGPGSGRYLAKVMAACRPSHYEIYETAEPWANYLVREYHVIYRRTDGRSLAETPTASIDLAQAHKVFVVTPFVSTWNYLREMVRVTKPGGYVVFDVMTERCLRARAIRRLDAAIVELLSQRVSPRICPAGVREPGRGVRRQLLRADATWPNGNVGLPEMIVRIDACNPVKTPRRANRRQGGR
jgi:hypothetical protein